MASPGGGTVSGEQLAEWLEAAAASIDPGELAYLALTSKIERPLQDRLAWLLHIRLPGWVVSREWRAIDIAILSAGAESPLVLLEAKAMYSFDVAWEHRAGAATYPRLMQQDIAKARALDPRASSWRVVRVRGGRRRGRPRSYVPPGGPVVSRGGRGVQAYRTRPACWMCGAFVSCAVTSGALACWAAGVRGKVTSMSRPPTGRARAVRAAPWASAMARTEDLIAYVTAHEDFPATELQEIGDELQRRQVADGEPDWVSGMWDTLMANGRRPDDGNDGNDGHLLSRTEGGACGRPDYCPAAVTGSGRAGIMPTPRPPAERGRGRFSAMGRVAARIPWP